jgi:hypothetical protein
MIDDGKAIALIQRNFPQVTIQTVHPITRGWDSFVLEVNDELIFRYEPFSQLLFGAYSGSEKFISQGIEGLRTMFKLRSSIQ